MPSSVRALRCSDPEWDGLHVPAEPIAHAASMCTKRGMQLTALSRQVLELLWQKGEPVGAYEVIQSLPVQNHALLLLQQYIASWSFLVSHGLVLEGESWNAYVPCAHPEHGEHLVILLCSSCRGLIALGNDTLYRLLKRAAASMRFLLRRRVTELEVVCVRTVYEGYSPRTTPSIVSLSAKTAPVVGGVTRSYRWIMDSNTVKEMII